jgi:hypothetical protein
MQWSAIRLWFSVEREPMRMPSLCCRPGSAFVLLAWVSSTAVAQTIGGQLLDASSKAVVGGLPVRLVRFQAGTPTRVDSGATDEAGAFELATAGPGVYRLEFGVAWPHVSYSTPDTIRGDSAVVRRYFVPKRQWDADEVFAPPAIPRPRFAVRSSEDAPRYPRSLFSAGIEGSAFMAMVIDTLGVPDTNSVLVVATAPEFADEIARTVRRYRYVPARKDGRAVRQLTCRFYEFGIGSTAPGAAPQLPTAALPAGVKSWCYLIDAPHPDGRQ